VYGGLFIRSFAHHHSCFVCIQPSIAFSGFVQGDQLTVLVRLPLAREFLNAQTVVIVFPSQNSLVLTNSLHSFLQTFLLSVNFKILLSSISTFVPTYEERPLSFLRSKRSPFFPNFCQHVTFMTSTKMWTFWDMVGQATLWFLAPEWAHN
jgi:hypothetical protein